MIQGKETNSLSKEWEMIVLYMTSSEFTVDH